MKWKAKRLLYLLLISNIYCIILSWLNGGPKVSQPIPFFFHFLTWWCVWNSILTIAFILWKTKKPRANTYFSQIFSLITMISSIIAMMIFSIGLVLWLTTVLTTHWGITDKVTKLVPIPGHRIMDEGKINFGQLGKVIHWWLYSPLWHLIAPAYFIYWFFRYEKKDLLRKKLRLTIFSCLIMPTLYFSYCFLRSKLSPKEYLTYPFSRWPYNFLSSKTMEKKFAISRPTWKILLVLFWFSLFSLIAYLSVKFGGKIKKYLLNKKKKIIEKKRSISHSRLHKNVKNKNVF